MLLECLCFYRQKIDPHHVFLWIPNLPSSSVVSLSAFVPFFSQAPIFHLQFLVSDPEESVASGAVQLTLDGSGELESVRVAPAAESEKPFWKKSPKLLAVIRSAKMLWGEWAKISWVKKYR